VTAYRTFVVTCAPANDISLPTTFTVTCCVVPPSYRHDQLVLGDSCRVRNMVLWYCGTWSRSRHSGYVDLALRYAGCLLLAFITRPSLAGSIKCWTPSVCLSVRPVPLIYTYSESHRNFKLIADIMQDTSNCDFHRFNDWITIRRKFGKNLL